MNNNLDNPLSPFDIVEPGINLFDSIITEINRRERRAENLHFSFFIFTAILALVFIIPSVRYLYADFYKSGFYQYLSIIFSDGDLVLAHWEDFVLLLADSFPALTVTAVLASTVLFLVSIKGLVLKIRPTFSLINFAQ